MEGGNFKIEDLIVNMSNFQCMILRQLCESMIRQSQALESIDKTLKKVANRPSSEKVLEKVLNSTETSGFGSSSISPMSGIAITSTLDMSSSPANPPDHQDQDLAKKIAEDPDWEGDDKTEIFCHDCKATFIRGTGHFTRHLKFTSCRPYKCYCGKLFKKKSSLTAHKSTHSTNVHKCKSCSSSFRCRQYLKNHIRRMHLMDLEDKSAVPQGNVPIEKAEEGSEHPDETFSEENSSFNPLDLLKLQLE